MPEIPAITSTFRLSANEIIANTLVIAFLIAPAFTVVLD
jgi:hypothetical protein